MQQAVRQVYLISASTGIGAATARMLARDGNAVFIAGQTREHCTALVQELGALGAEAECYVGDLALAETAWQVVQACQKCFGRIDGLFNVAGISGRRFGDGPVHECSEAGWEKVMVTNLYSQYRMNRETVRVMLGQEPSNSGQRGVILNMASILGIHPEPKYFATHAYAASKGAIIALSRSMAATYALNKIRVNAIAPSLVKTAMSARASEDAEILKFMKHKQPLVGDLIDVADVASAAHFLLTDASHAITGEVLEVDAGWDLV